jgi:acyl dehydratase
MALNPGLAGRTFPPTRPYIVSREKITEFGTAIGADSEEDVAPPTFSIVIAFRAMQDLMTDPDVGIELRNVVHGDQRFSYARPIRAGDELVATLTVDSVRNSAGMDMISTRTDITTTGGEAVAIAHALLLHRANASDVKPSDVKPSDPGGEK